MLKVPDEEVLVIYGIDFSGAQDAGNKIWIAKGVPEGESLLISECGTGVGPRQQYEIKVEVLKNSYKRKLRTAFSTSI